MIVKHESVTLYLTCGELMCKLYDSLFSLEILMTFFCFIKLFKLMLHSHLIVFAVLNCICQRVFVVKG